MFGTIRKHQQWLWAIIITLTIISFVIFFTPTSKTGNGGRDSGSNYGTISGEAITKDDFENAQKEILLQYFFMSGGNWYNEQDAKKNNFDVDQRSYARLLLIKKEDQYGIRVSSDMAGRYATQMLRQFERNGPITPDAFVTQVLKPRGLGYDDFDRFVRHELGIQELMSTIGTSGKLVTPQEGQELYRREHQELVTEAVIFAASNYLASISASPEVVGQFYTNQLANYRVPDRVQVAYVKFAYSNYFAKAEKEMTNLNESVELSFSKMGTNAFPEAKTPEETKAKIKEEFLRRAAVPMARNDANQFAGPLFENTPLALAAFPQLAKTNGLEVAVTAPFGRDETPKGLDVAADFGKAAFGLTEAEPYAQPIIGRDGVYVIAFNHRIPSEIPTLDQIRDRVTFDYKMTQAIMQARKAGMEFSQSVSNGMAQGKTFAAVATEAKLKPVDLPPLSLTTRELTNFNEHVPLEFLKEVAFSTPPGKVSPFRPASQGGIVVHVKSTLPLDEAKMKAELAGFLAYVRQTRQREAFETWFRKEAQRAITDAPMLQKQQAPRGPGSAASS